MGFRGSSMEGIRYVINDQGEKTAVLIDLEGMVSFGKTSVT
jgi:hypothetical protein